MRVTKIPTEKFCLIAITIGFLKKNYTTFVFICIDVTLIPLDIRAESLIALDVKVSKC